MRKQRKKNRFSFVPSLEPLVKTLNKIVGNIIFEAVDTDVLDIENGLYRYLVSTVTVRNDGLGLTMFSGLMQHRYSLWRIAVGREMKTNDKAGLAIDNEPAIVFDTGYLNHRFIGAPLVGINVEHGHKLNAHVIKKRRISSTPFTDGHMKNLNPPDCAQDQADVTE